MLVLDPWETLPNSRASASRTEVKAPVPLPMSWNGWGVARCGVAPNELPFERVVVPVMVGFQTLRAISNVFSIRVYVANPRVSSDLFRFCFKLKLQALRRRS